MVAGIKQLNKSKISIVKFNKELDKLANKILFPEKLAEANRSKKKWVYQS
jgi:hypothetical protein